MKSLIVILMLLIVVAGVIFASYLAYDALFLFPSHSEKKVEVANKVSADTMTLSSCKKKQVCEFNKLVKKLKESSYAFSLIKIDLSHGCDPISLEKPPATIAQLSNWQSFDFIYLEFPDGFMNEQPGILSIHCDNYDKKNPEFFAKIKTVVKNTSRGSIEKSIPYYMARTGKESISKTEEQKYVLEAIEYALHAIKLTVACDRAASALLRMEKEEKKGHKPPSVIITSEDTVSKY